MAFPKSGFGQNFLSAPQRPHQKRESYPYCLAASENCLEGDGVDREKKGRKDAQRKVGDLVPLNLLLNSA